MNNLSQQGTVSRLNRFAYITGEVKTAPAGIEACRRLVLRITRFLNLVSLAEMAGAGLGDEFVISLLKDDPALAYSHNVIAFHEWSIRNLRLRSFADRKQRKLYLTLFMKMVPYLNLNSAGADVSNSEELAGGFASLFQVWLSFLTDEIELELITSNSRPDLWDDFTVMAGRHHPQIRTARNELIDIYPFGVEYGGDFWFWEGRPAHTAYSRAGQNVTEIKEPVIKRDLGLMFVMLMVPDMVGRAGSSPEWVRVTDSLNELTDCIEKQDYSLLETAVDTYLYALHRLPQFNLRRKNLYLDYLKIAARYLSGKLEDPSPELQGMVSLVPGLIAPYRLLIEANRKMGRSVWAERWERQAERLFISEDIDEQMEIEKKIKGMLAKKRRSKMGKELTDLREKLQNRSVELIGREKEIAEACEILSCMKRNNIIVTGEPGVGKSEFVYALSSSETLPEVLKDSPFYELNLNALFSGVQYRGQLEEKMIKQFDALEKEGGVLFIDDLHELFRESLSRSSLADVGTMLKPYLEKNAFRVIGATTFTQYARLTENGGVFSRLFQKLELEESPLPVIAKIMEQKSRKFAEYHRVNINIHEVNTHLEMVKQFFRERMLPDKAIELLDRACARSAAQQKNAAAVSIPLVGEKDFLQTLADARGVEVSAVSATLRQRLGNLEQAMRKSILGQDQVLDSMMKRIIPARMGLKMNEQRPDGVFLFVGPTGVGKTETARVLSRELFGDEKKLLRIDMSEYMEEIAVTRLVGAAPGYVGYDDENQLIDEVRRDPYRVVLLDEIEKAHPLLINIFLQVFDSGVLTDSRGNRAYFDKTIIIMTSNVGSSAAAVNRIGFPESAAQGGNLTRASQTKAMKRFFKPEFLNRIDQVVFFNSLNIEHARGIVRLNLKRLNDRFALRGLKITCSRSAVDLLAQKGFSHEYGAREILRTIDREILRPLSTVLLKASRTVVAVRVGTDSRGEKFSFRCRYAG